MNLFNKKSFIIVLFIILSIITICSLGLAYYLLNSNNEILIEPVLANTIAETDEKNDDVYVEVKGAVKKPGVYQVSNTSIINDVITLAGGFTKSAWSNNINLSRRVTNELVIYVFTKTEYKNNNKQNSTVKNVSNMENVTNIVTDSLKEGYSNGYLIDNCTNNNISIINSSENVLPEVINTDDNNTLININSASFDELLTLPGIGESKAQSIIDYRNNFGRFNSKEDLLNISGISEKTFEKLVELIII